MSTCSFFGEMTEEELTPELAGCLYSLLEYLIENCDVTSFYTTSETEFQKICETMLSVIKEKHENVLLTIFIKQNETLPAEKTIFDRIVKHKSSSLKVRREFVSQISDYVLLDRIESSSITEDIFSHLAVKSLTNKNFVTNIIPLDKIYKKMQNK